MKSYKIKVLLIGGLFIFSLNTLAKVILQDVFIYRVTDDVYSLSDIENMNKEFSVLACLYEDSLLIKSFPSLVGVKRKDLSLKKVNLKAIPKKTEEIFEQAVLASKLNQYVETHNVHISKKLKKAFYLASRSDCNEIAIFKNSNLFTSSFKKILSSELFLRKRFLGEKKRSIRSKDSKKTLVSIKALLDIIQKQVDSELYWKK